MSNSKNFQTRVGLFVAVMALGACGKAPQSMSDPMIVGGSKVSASDPIIKSTVSLLQPDGWQFCSGSLIDATHVVTAAHCLAEYTDSTLFVGFGGSAKAAFQSVSLKRQAAKWEFNSAYDPNAMNADPTTTAPNDIGLVTLSEEAPSAYEGVAMLSLSDTVTVGEALTLAGFGLTKATDNNSAGTLRKVTTKLIAASDTAKEITFGDTPGKGACMGDSGGPAFVARDGGLVLLGVTSRGSSQCDADGIYTDVRYFQDWIASKQ